MALNQRKKIDAVFRALFKMAGVILWIAIFYPAVWLAYKLKKFEARDSILQFCCKGILGICEIKLKVVSQQTDARPLMLVSNHLSYFDIPILFSVAKVAMTPKSDIAAWPIISSICAITGSIFIERSAEKILDATASLKAAMSKGQVVALYPEATTGNGHEVLPFKASFFKLADEKIQDRPVTIQPVALTYKSICGLPIDRTQWPNVAWYGDMELVPHLWHFLGLGPLDVELAFLEPVTIENFADRKAMAIHCQDVIAKQIEKSKQQKSISHQNKTLSLPFSFSKSKS